MMIYYLAHPYGGSIENLARARRWLEWFRASGYFVIAPWIVDVELHDDADPGQRAAGLSLDCAVVKRCDALILCGGRISPGMQEELDAAQGVGLRIRDLTFMGEEPPREHVTLAVEEWE